MAKSKSTSTGQELLSAAAANATAEPVVTETPPPAPPEVAATTEATTPETVTETPPPPPQPDFLESLRSVGFENVTSAEEAQQRLLEAYRTQQERYQQLESRVKEIEPLSNYGREYIQHLRTPSPQPPLPNRKSSLPTGGRRLGLRSGDYVRLRNQDGVISDRVKARVTAAIRPDCVYMVHGFGHTSKGLRSTFGKGASDAQLMTRYAVDPLMGGTGINVNFVTIEQGA